MTPNILSQHSISLAMWGRLVGVPSGSGGLSIRLPHTAPMPVAYSPPRPSETP